MDLPFEQIAVARDVLARCLDGGSSVLIGPRYFGKHELLRWLVASWRSQAAGRAALLDVEMLSSQGPALMNLQRAVLKELEKPAKAGEEAEQLGERFLTSTRRLKHPFLIALRGGWGGAVPIVGDLLQHLHSILNDAHGKLVVVCSSTHTLFEHYRRVEASIPSSFARHLFEVLSGDEVAAVTGAFAGSDERDLTQSELKDSATCIVELTGGHPGLVSSLLRDVRNRGWNIAPDYWRGAGKQSLLSCHIATSIRDLIEKDPEELTREALEYIKPSVPQSRNPAGLLLREWGVIVSGVHPGHRLCPGVISEIVVGIARVAVPPPPAARFDMQLVGQKTNVPAAIRKTSFTVLLLSDLHVGTGYRFRVTWNGGGLNDAERFLEDMIREDLASLGLDGKVDCVIIAGDTLHGKNEGEVLRARDILTSVAMAAGTVTQNMVLIPGNHDVRWKPDELSSTMPGRAVSMDRFETLYEMVKGRKWDTCEITAVEKPGVKGRLIIVGVNSNFAAVPGMESIGYVAPDELIVVDSRLGALSPSLSADDSLWLVLHHHVFPATVARVDKALKGEVSVLGNASELLRWARANRVRIIVHGHEHQPLVTVGRQWPDDNGQVTEDVVVVGCGSAGAVQSDLGPFGSNHYYIIQADGRELTILSRKLGHSGRAFSAHGHLKLAWS